MEFTWIVGLYMAVVAGMFSVFVASAVLAGKGAFIGGTAGGLFAATLILFLVFAIMTLWLLKTSLGAHIYIAQTVGTCIALFFALSAAQITYIQQIAS
jgi:hypothetical protein